MNLLDPSIIRRTLRSSLILLTLSTVLGAVIGVSAMHFVGAQKWAMGIVEIGSYVRTFGRDIRQQPIESTKTTLARVASSEYLGAVARKLGDQSAERSMLEVRYGGEGALQVGLVRDSNLLEIRARGDSSAQAIERTNAAMQVLIDQHEGLRTPRKVIEGAQLKELEAVIVELTRSKSLIEARLAIAQNTSDLGLIAASLAEKNQLSIYADEIKLKTAIHQSLMESREPYDLPTRIVMYARKLDNFLTPVRAGVLGAFAGIALAFSFIQMRKMIV